MTSAELLHDVLDSVASCRYRPFSLSPIQQCLHAVWLLSRARTALYASAGMMRQGCVSLWQDTRLQSLPRRSSLGSFDQFIVQCFCTVSVGARRVRWSRKRNPVFLLFCPLLGPLKYAIFTSGTLFPTQPCSTTS